MAKCQIKIQTPGNQRIYKLGDKVKGEVLVAVNDTCRCKGLVLTHYWKTHGRGDRDTRQVRSLTLFQGTWQSGVKRYPFELPLDKIIPPSYKGKYVNLDHYLKVTADIPWAIDPKHEIDIITQQSQDNLNIKRGLDTYNRKIPFWFYFVPASVAWSIFLSSFIFSIGESEGIPFNDGAFHINGNLVTKLLSFVLGSFTTYHLYLLQRRRRLGKFQVRTHYLPQKHKLAVEISFEPNQAVSIDHIEAILVNEEVAEVSSRTTKTLYRHHVELNKTRLCGVKHIRKGSAVTIRSSVNLPKDIQPTFRTSSNWLKWKVKIDIVGKGITQSVDHYFQVVSTP